MSALHRHHPHIINQKTKKKPQQEKTNELLETTVYSKRIGRKKSARTQAQKQEIKKAKANSTPRGGAEKAEEVEGERKRVKKVKDQKKAKQMENSDFFNEKV